MRRLAVVVAAVGAVVVRGAVRGAVVDAAAIVVGIRVAVAVMCDCNDFDPPSAFSATWRRARKIHACYAT
jgi:hypothetical protein